jgi:hypothetical protein
MTSGNPGASISVNLRLITIYYLIGNRFSGTIAAFNATTENFLGNLVLIEQLVALRRDRNELASAARVYVGVNAAGYGAAVVARFHLDSRNRQVAFEHV